MPDYHQYGEYSIPVCTGKSARDLYNLPDDQIDRLRTGTIECEGSCMEPGGFRGTPFADKFEYLDDQAIKELAEFHKANRSSLLHLFQDAKVPVKDQNGHGYSHTEDTEVLTERGWTPWPEWNRKDLLATVDLRTNLMEYQAPTECHAYEYDDEMYYSTNRRLDFGVTKNHRMIVRKWDEAKRTLSDRYTEQRADELGWYVGMMAAPCGHLGTILNKVTVEGDNRTYSGDDFLALLALIVSDGYAGGSESTHDRISFCNFHANEREGIQALAARTGFKEQPGRKGVWTRYSVPLANWVRANCYVSSDLGAKNKRVPELVQVASTYQIKHFLAHFHDCNRQSTQYYSTSKQLIDDLQILHLKLGKRSSIGHRGPRESEYNGKTIRSSGEYTLTVSQTDRLCVERKKHIETDHYKGLVYCATVPNGTLVTRRNGSVLISGNCWAYGAISALEANRLAQGLPYVELSPHSVAAGVMKGADRGGWASMALQWTDEHGVVPDSLWPKHSRQYRLWDKPEIAEAAAKYKPLEWIDIPERDMRAERTLLAFNLACGMGIPWWGHLIMFAIIDWSDKYGWLYGQRNSHGPNFGADGWAFHTETSAMHMGGSTVIVA